MSILNPKLTVDLESVYTVTPTRLIENEYFEKFFDQKDIIKSSKLTGIQSRFWCNESETTIDLCSEAAKSLIKDRDVDIDDIDALVLVTQTPDYQIPASSYICHKNLDLKESCLVFDVNLGCSGYIYGYFLATSLINSGCKKVLLLAGETSSKTIDLKDPGTSMLFGDAGSASLFSESKNADKDQKFSFKSDGRGYDNIIIPSGISRKSNLEQHAGVQEGKLYMNGPGVFNFTITKVPDLITSFSKSLNQDISEWDFVLLHQPNKFIIDHIYKKIKVNENAAFSNINKFGNTSSASIPLLISDLGQKINTETRVLGAGFGVGLSWAATNITFSKNFTSLHITKT